MSLVLVITAFVSFYLGYMISMILMASRNCICGDCEDCEYDCDRKK